MEMFLGRLNGKRHTIFSWRAVLKTPKASHRDGVGLTGGHSRGRVRQTTLLAFVSSAAVALQSDAPWNTVCREYP